jgi:hypothetical protein
MVVTDIVLPSAPPSAPPSYLHVSGRGLEPKGTFYQGEREEGAEAGEGKESIDPQKMGGR